MANEVLSSPLGELSASSTADGGSALTTTASYIQLLQNAYYVMITPRNFSTAVVAKFKINPWLVVLKTTDGGVNFTDYSLYAQDNSTTEVDLGGLSTLANGDFLLVGAHLPFRGVYGTIHNTNSAGTATTSVYYWNGHSWVDTSATDGTNSTMTFAQSGLVYWTVPSAWALAKLNDLYPDNIFPATPLYPYGNMHLYWTRWSVSAALADTSITFYSMLAANRDTKYMELVSGQSFEERISWGPQGYGCVEALTNAGTANLIVNVATKSGEQF